MADAQFHVGYPVIERTQARLPVRRIAAGLALLFIATVCGGLMFFSR